MTFTQSCRVRYMYAGWPWYGTITILRDKDAKVLFDSELDY